MNILNARENNEGMINKPSDNSNSIAGIRLSTSWKSIFTTLVKILTTLGALSIKVVYINVNMCRNC